MAITKFKLVEEEGNQITEEMKEFFSVDENGVVGYDHDNALKALREERNGRRDDLSVAEKSTNQAKESAAL